MNEQLEQKNKKSPKIVWITGASSGIGEALAKIFAHQGAIIILSSRRKEQLEFVRQQLDRPEQHLVLPFDICDEQQAREAVSTVFQKYSRLDVLINNAGVSQRASIAETSMQTERKIMEIDYFAQIYLTKLVLPYLQTQQSGQIAFMSSIAGLLGTQYRATYSAAKAALHLWANSCRAEYAQYGIDVSVIFPGFVQTNISFNALNGAGQAQNHQDDVIEQGLDVNIFAKQVVRALSAKEPYIVVGGIKEKMGVFLSKVSPKTLYKIIRQTKVK